MESNATMGFILIGLALVIYLLPALIAGNRNHRNGPAIFVLNLFLGWTFLGWVLALVWAFTDNTVKPEEKNEPES